MTIIRTVNDTTYLFNLTDAELHDAHREYVISFMQNELETAFNVPQHVSKDYAEIAYDYYAMGNGETEYDCIEKAYNEYLENENETAQS